MPAQPALKGTQALPAPKDPLELRALPGQLVLQHLWGRYKHWRQKSQSLNSD